MKTIDDFQNLHTKVFDLFEYKHDDKNYGVMEDWRSHASSVNENKVFVDDCDGFAFTMCELMIEADFPKDKIMFIVCTADNGEGHAVCGYECDGTTYISENNYKKVYDWNSKPLYKWQYFMKFDEPGQWYKITND